MICNQNTKREALGVLVFGGILERIKSRFIAKEGTNSVLLLYVSMKGDDYFRVAAVVIEMSLLFLL